MGVDPWPPRGCLVEFRRWRSAADHRVPRLQPTVCGSAHTPERAVVYCSRMYRAEQTAEGLRVFGDIDIAVADEFAQSLVDAFQTASGTVVVDLSAIEFFDSSGVGALLTSVQTLGGSWLVETSPFVFKVLNLVGITSGQVANLQVRPPKQRGH